MTRLTPVFLVLLRLAIGWHFFFEGVEKLNNPAWSSAGYLREATGPLADGFHALAGDPLVDYFAEAPEKQLPPVLDREWDDTFERFSTHYQLPAHPEQWEVAREKLDAYKTQLASWLAGIGPGKKVSKSAYGVTVEIEQSPRQRFVEYTKKAKEVSDLEKKSLTTFGPSVNAKLAAAKADMYRVRGDLLAEFAGRKLDLKKSLREVLTPEQKKTLDPPEFTLDDEGPAMAAALREAPVVHHPTMKDFQATPLQPSWSDGRWLTSWNRQTWADNAVRYGLLAIGGCLLIGLFTRTSCVAGALLLLSFYLAMPPFPWLPDNPKVEGHYFYVNKNLIEMLALLTLATTRSGRWVGVDGLISLLNPWRYRGKPAPAPSAGIRPELAPTNTNGSHEPDLNPSPKEPAHGH